MSNYIFRRMLLIIPTLFLISIVVFVIIRVMPGGIVDTLVQEAAMRGGSIDRQALERSLGLDAPVHIQYGRWIRDLLLHGSLGDSLNAGLPVTEIILSRMWVTAELGFLAIAASLLHGLPIGAYSAFRQDTVGDYIARSFAIIFLAVPTFWLATMIILYSSIWWGWLPPLEVIPFTDDPLGNLKQFILPSLLTGMFMSGVCMRMTRTMMLEVLRQDYIRTAYAKGLSGGPVLVRHAVLKIASHTATPVGLCTHKSQSAFPTVLIASEPIARL